MKLRWKLLLIMLGIALIPMTIMRGYGERSVRMLGDKLSGHIKDVLIQRATLELSILVEEHARIMQLERMLIEQDLKLQASEIEKRLWGDPYRAIGGGKSTKAESDTAAVQAMGLYGQPGTLRNMGAMPHFVSYDVQTYWRPPVPGKDATEYLEKMASMVSVLRTIAEEHGEHILWQITAFEDGTQMIYPGLEAYPPMYDALDQKWYRQSRERREIFWTQAVVDPITETLNFVVSAPLLENNGKFVGATAIVVPVGLILHQDDHIRRLSENVSYLIVRPEYSQGLAKEAVRIVAYDQKVEDGHHHWERSGVEEWLVIEDPDANARLLSDFSKQKNGIVELKFRGHQSVAAYGAIDAFGSALVLIVNREEVIADAAAMESFIHLLIGKQIAITGVILIAVVIGVVFLTLWLSRSMTRRIQKLVKASQRVSAGDFQTRADIKSRDEIGELGKAFDRMVPVLEKQIEMKKALDVASEVQQSLLPRQMPRIEGLDIAAKSIYCDETGGDFFDFMDFCCRDSSVTGVAVGDVSGHGIPAALLMATIRAFLRSRVMQPGGLAEIIDDVNQLIVKDADETVQFVTLFYAEIDTSEKKIEWVRAGHDPAFIYDPQTEAFEELMGKGLPLGVEADTVYASNVLTGLSQGQVIVIGTDGVWETINASGEMFGKNRLKSIVQKNSPTSSQVMLDTIFQALKEFGGGVKQRDDITLMVITLQ